MTSVYDRFSYRHKRLIADIKKNVSKHALRYEQEFSFSDYIPEDTREREEFFYAVKGLCVKDDRTEEQRQLMLTVLEHVQRHPETWDQERWHCGTSHCFAGFAQTWNGAEGDSSTCQEAALEALGITREGGQLLFDCYNTMEEIVTFVRMLT